jgi:CRISPR-associated protein Csc1
MQIYRGTLELLDYVFYATVERGKVYETGAFIHNYALVYALGLAQSDTYTYAKLKQEPHYVEELTPLNWYIYVTPGAPLQIAHRLVQWNTTREGYVFPGKERSLGYPDWGFARMLRPGCRFTFYLLVHDRDALSYAPTPRGLLVGKPVRIRLGKFLGKARLWTEAASAVTTKDGPFETNVFLNWRDLETDPQVCDVVAASLPTRLLSRARFVEGPCYEARFGQDVVHLPVRMRFLARPPKTNTRRAGKRR